MHTCMHTHNPIPSQFLPSPNLDLTSVHSIALTLIRTSKKKFFHCIRTTLWSPGGLLVLTRLVLLSEKVPIRSQKYLCTHVHVNRHCYQETGHTEDKEQCAIFLSTSRFNWVMCQCGQELGFTEHVFIVFFSTIQRYLYLRDNKVIFFLSFCWYITVCDVI